MDTVTVIVPVYNVLDYLDECVKSIINQSYKNLEILLIDDGSTDGSGHKCDEYAAMDKRVVVLHKKNGGLSDARNAGIDIMQGKYVTFVDSDDFLSTSAIELMVKEIEKSKTDMVFTIDAYRFRDGEKVALCSLNDAYSVDVYKNDEVLEHLLYQRTNITGAPGKLYKSHLFKNTQIRYPFGLYFEDLATTYRLILASDKITMMNCKLYAYRMRESSIIHQQFSPKKLSCIEITRKLYSDIIEKKTQLRKAAASRCCSCNRMVYTQIPRSNIQYRQMVWNEYVKYRSTVLFDRNARKKERLSCLISYLGQNAFLKFNQLGLKLSR